MTSETLFLIQLVFGYIAWLLCFGTYLWPRLKVMDRAGAHRVIATLHSFRFFGLVFILPGIVGSNLPASFATFAAYGDFATGVVAILALVTVRVRPLFWSFVVAFNLVGATDIIVDYFHAIQAGVPAMAGQLGATYAIVVLYVPLLMITHVVASYLLLRPRCEQVMDSGAVDSQERRTEMSDQFGAVTGAVAYEDQISSEQAWFADGERISYDPKARAIIEGGGAPLRIFLRREGDLAQAVSFLPGFPDGSFGWAKIRPHLPDAAEMPKLFLDYVGMGDSDKPKDYAYSTAERTDLVEAIWRDLSVQSTTLVAFDFSSLVVLEHLRRRLERIQRGDPAGGPDIRGVLIFNGGLFTDGHSHPWYTTPMLRRLPNGVRRRLPFALFKRMPGVRKMWSIGYHVTDAELRELHSAMDRHDGLFYLAAAAGFVADHKAQGDRLDFGQLFEAYRDQFPFLVGGSNEDPFEHQQVDLAQERLGKLGLTIERLPGGHLTTNEQPEALAALIAKFERELARRLERAEGAWAPPNT